MLTAKITAYRHHHNTFPAPFVSASSTFVRDAFRSNRRDESVNGPNPSRADAPPSRLYLAQPANQACRNPASVRVVFPVPLGPAMTSSRGRSVATMFTSRHPRPVHVHARSPRLRLMLVADFQRAFCPIRRDVRERPEAPLVPRSPVPHRWDPYPVPSCREVSYLGLQQNRPCLYHARA